MRVNKFRVWDKEHNEFVKDYPVMVDQEGNIWGFTGYGDNAEIKKRRYEIDFTTNLFDAKGNEIFINDIVKNNYSEEYYLVEIVNDVVIEPFISWLHNEDVEVVGNVRENTEMLERDEE